MGHFFRLCLQAAFHYTLWEKAQGLAAAVVCALGLATRFGAKWLPGIPKIDDWVIIVSAVLLLILLRLIASPYWVYKRVINQRDIFRNGLMKRGFHQEVEEVERINPAD